MNKRIVLSILYLLVNILAIGQAPISFELSVESIFESVNNPEVPGVSAGVIKDGKIIYLKGFGSANVETGDQITPQTKFQLGELSKQFTSLAILIATRPNVAYFKKVKHVGECARLSSRQNRRDETKRHGCLLRKPSLI